MPGPLQLLSPPFLTTSTTKQMRPNGRGRLEGYIIVTFNAVMKHETSYVRATVRFVHERKHRLSFGTGRLIRPVHCAGSQPGCSSTSAADLPRHSLAFDRLIPATLPNMVINRTKARTAGWPHVIGNYYQRVLRAMLSASRQQGRQASTFTTSSLLLPLGVNK